MDPDRMPAERLECTHSIEFLPAGPCVWAPPVYPPLSPCGRARPQADSTSCTRSHHERRR